jgi:hypothetical protein
MKRTHGIDHYTPNSCFGCQVLTVSFSADAMPSRNPQVVESNAMEKQWARDHPAYKRLVADGIQPNSLDGAANIEQMANSKWEAEHITLEDATTYNT